MSKVFKVKSSSHSNAVEESEYKALSENIDNGCFGVELTNPTLGADVVAGQTFSVQIRKSIGLFLTTDVIINPPIYRTWFRCSHRVFDQSSTLHCQLGYSWICQGPR